MKALNLSNSADPLKVFGSGGTCRRWFLLVATKVAFSIIVLTSRTTFAVGTCSGEIVIGSCDKFAKLPADLNGAKELGLPKYNDGSTIYNAVAGFELKEAPPIQLSSDQITRAQVLTAKARAAAKSIVSGNTSQESWTSEQKAMLARLDSVKIVIADKDEALCSAENAVVKIMPNAFYIEARHSVIVCPSAIRLAPAALLMVVTHEFGHVVSPCVMAKADYKVMDNNALSETSAKRCLASKVEIDIAKEFFSKSSETIVSRGLSTKENQVIKKLLGCDLIKLEDDRTSRQRPFLFSKFSKCLDRRYASNWKLFQGKKKRKRASQIEPGGENSLVCHGIYEEHFADGFGARAFGKILEDVSQPAEIAKVGLVEMASYACKGKRQKPDKGGPFDYPRSEERLSLQMSDANTQRALGCSLSAAGTCIIEGLTYSKDDGLTNFNPAVPSTSRGGVQ